MTDTTDNIALVTGASRGIVAATAIQLTQQGYDVCINYRHHADEVASAITWLLSDAPAYVTASFTEVSGGR